MTLIADAEIRFSHEPTVDRHTDLADNFIMSTAIASTAASNTEAEVFADATAVLAALKSGGTLDPAIALRIQERSLRTRERILREHGEVDIAVPSIRELRDA